MTKVVFAQGEMMNKKMYTVTMLPVDMYPNIFGVIGYPGLCSKNKYYDEWNTPFQEKMKFKMLQKSYKDVVDECDDVVHGSSITFSGNAASVRL